MKKSIHIICNVIVVLAVVSCKNSSDEFRTISSLTLKDKIAGGWAGKMIGVTYGAPTEFRAEGKTYEDTIRWQPSDVTGSIWQDDLYVQLTFLMSMDKYGMDAPAKKFQEMFAKAGYPLWHANMQARKNYYDSIFAPASGNPENNYHADDIDFQIEADYIGFMNPGMPGNIIALGDKIGHIMNYGEGVYGGIFVGALYSEAFFESDIQKIIENALKTIPAESDYYKIIKDVIKLHQHNSADWRSSWKELEAKWGEVDICGAGDSFNIDAKLNGAYIVMGLLYGDSDPWKTLEITTRCGQDSDCNPSNALAVLGVILGFSNLPDDMSADVEAMGDSIFINTTYSFNRAVESTFNYAVQLVKKNGGRVSGKNIIIKTQHAVPQRPEISFPNVVFDRYISALDKKAWSTRGNWISKLNPDKKSEDFHALMSPKAGDEIELTFNGTGVSITGDWVKDGGKADIYLDGKLNRTIDTYYNFSNQEHTGVSIWHAFQLSPGNHVVRVVVKGEKRPESAGTGLYISGALIFKTVPKKSDNYKFSFE